MLAAENVLFFDRLALGLGISPGPVHHMHRVRKFVVEVLDSRVLDGSTTCIKYPVTAVIGNIKIKVDIDRFTVTIG